jgi:hypothetical protein
MYPVKLSLNEFLEPWWVRGSHWLLEVMGD